MNDCNSRESYLNKCLISGKITQVYLMCLNIGIIDCKVMQTKKDAETSSVKYIQVVLCNTVCSCKEISHVFQKISHFNQGIQEHV